jgi:hypothetical protein
MLVSLLNICNNTLLFTLQSSMLKGAIEKIKTARAPITLDLSWRILSLKNITSLVEAIKEAQVPIELYLVYNAIGLCGTVLLADAIKQARNTIALNLSYNRIRNDGAKVIADAIAQVTTFLVLDLSNNYIEDVGVILLADAIKRTSGSIALNLSANNIMINGIAALADAIKEASTPFSLDLSRNNIPHAGISFLAEAIKKAQLPVTLSLCGNRIGDAGAELLAAAIRVAGTSIYLNLSRNSIGVTGTKSLSAAIEVTSVPLYLNLRNNYIGIVGVQLLCSAIRKAKAPLSLRLNNIEYVCGLSLAQAINESRVPLKLDLSFSGTKYISDMFLSNEIKDNFIINAGAKPSEFLARIKFCLSRRMLEQELGYPSVMVILIQEYIGPADLAWIEVAAIRAIEGASHKNKYSSINYELLNAAYFNNRQPLNQISCYRQEEMEGNYSASASNRGDKVDDSKGGKLSSSASSPGSSSWTRSEIDSAELSNQEMSVINYIASDIQAINYEYQQAVDNDKVATENLLMTLFTWIKELSKKQQEKLLSSFSMQRVLKSLEASDKIVIEQLNNKPLEYRFTTDYQKYYSQYDSADNTTDYAEVNQRDCIALVDYNVS